MKTLLIQSAIFALLAAFPVIAASTSVASGKTVAYSMGDREYVSSAILEFINPPGDLQLPQELIAKAQREYIENQRREILSDENLKAAINKLIPGAGQDLNPFFDKAKEGLVVTNIRGTDLFQITVTFGDKEFTRDLANRLAEQYLKLHKPKGNEKGPIIHEKAVIGVPNNKKE